MAANSTSRYNEIVATFISQQNYIILQRDIGLSKFYPEGSKFLTCIYLFIVLIHILIQYRSRPLKLDNTRVASEYTN